MRGVRFAWLQPIKGNVLRIAIKDARHPVAGETFDAAFVHACVLDRAHLGDELTARAVFQHETAGRFQGRLCPVGARGLEARTEQCCLIVIALDLHVAG